MLSFLGFGPQAVIDIEIGDRKSRKSIEVPLGNRAERMPTYTGDDDPIFGTIKMYVKDGKRLDHIGIKCELKGQVELFSDRGQHHEFLSIERTLMPPGVLDSPKEFEFEFNDVEKQYESYYGINATLRYFVRVTIARQGMAQNFTKDVDLFVLTYPEPPEINNTIKMEVGIEDCLHIEFEYGKSKYHLKDVVIGKIYFLLVRIKIKHMEIALIRRESSGSGSSAYNESETLTKFEIMDGAPVKGESIPVRLFLGGFDLTPTYRNVLNKFSLKYYLNLVLVDEEDRRYFKQQEITLWRKVPAHLKDRVQPTQAYSGKREAAEEREAEEREARERDKIAKRKKERAREKKERERARREAEGDEASAGDDAEEEGEDGGGGGDGDDEEEERRRAKKEKKEKKRRQREEEEAAAAAAAAADEEAGGNDDDDDGL